MRAGVWRDNNSVHAAPALRCPCRVKSSQPLPQVASLSHVITTHFVSSAVVRSNHRINAGWGASIRLPAPPACHVHVRAAPCYLQTMGASMVPEFHAGGNEVLLVEHW